MKFLIFIALALTTVSAKVINSNYRISPGFKPKGRIVGGQNADIVDFSYQVGLSLKKDIFDSYWCGGSLISAEWVLTAAHCMEDKQEVTVYLGGTERAQAEVEYVIKRNATNVIVHEGYKSRTKLNDIALIRIPTVEFSDKIKPLRLHRSNCNDGDFAKDSKKLESCNDETFVGDFGTASGWGRLGDDVTESTTNLQSVTMRIITNAECVRTYSKMFITNGNICVATKDGDVKRSTCEGDSGGPLVLRGTNLQIGLTSIGVRNQCEKGYPIGFTRISAFVDWISEKTGLVI